MIGDMECVVDFEVIFGGIEIKVVGYDYISKIYWEMYIDFLIVWRFVVLVCVYNFIYIKLDFKFIMYKYLLIVFVLFELFMYILDVFILNFVFKLYLYLGFIYIILVYFVD